MFHQMLLNLVGNSLLSGKQISFCNKSPLKITNIPATLFLTFGQGFKFSEIFHLFLDRVNCMYIYFLFSVLFDTGGFFTSHKFVFQ